LRGCNIPQQYDVIVAEKPRAADKIAHALGRPAKCFINRVPVYLLSVDGHNLVVVSSAGHMFGPSTSIKGLPVTTLRWDPIWRFDRRSSYLKPYYEVLSKVLPRARYFVNACDYDIEGSTIGYKIIEAFGSLSRAKRMKFSSLTPAELRSAYSRLQPLDVNNAMAGIARAEMDWLWGINVSRLLMRSYREAAGERISLSAGRVQTPTLAEAVRRWIQVNSHVPAPEPSITATLSHGGVEFSASPSGWGAETVKDARAIALEVKEGGYMKVASVKAYSEPIRPPPPFNLTDLQREAARIYGLSPYRTQEVAEDLYLAALISYPRTNSERLPPTLNYREVMDGLTRQAKYRGLVELLLRQTKGALRPREGPADDPAHPAIYPTGEMPSKLDKVHDAIYDLIVRRFLAAFAPPAEVARAEAQLLDVKLRRWEARGLSIISEGWLKYYHFHRPSEAQLPPLREGDRPRVERVTVKVSWGGPGVRLSRLSLLEWMEANGLGTKGTRARTIETLYRRGFIVQRGRQTEITDLGYAVYKVLSNVAPELLSVSLTRQFEDMLEGIAEGRLSRDEVVGKAKKYISELIASQLNGNVKVIGATMAKFVGKVRPEGRCIICGRPAEGEELCELHLEAKRRLERSLEDVARRLGVSADEALRRLAKNRLTGRWVREVAELALAGTLRLDAGRVEHE